MSDCSEMHELKPNKCVVDPETAAAMAAVRHGADVWDRYMAGLLRTVERMRPQWIDIGKAEMAPEDGAQRQPYFGAILTQAGRSALCRACKQLGLKFPRHRRTP